MDYLTEEFNKIINQQYAIGKDRYMDAYCILNELEYSMALYNLINDLVDKVDGPNEMFTELYDLFLEYYEDHIDLINHRLSTGKTKVFFD